MKLLSALTRIFTTKICPTCSKAVHRSKLATHLRRHAAGRSQYQQHWITDGQRGAVVTFRRGADRVWRIHERQEANQYLPAGSPLLQAAEEKAALLNAITATPIFSKRQVPDAEPAVAHEAPVSSYSPPNDPAPNTLL